MGRVVWDESNLVGVSSIDAQHRDLVELIDTLNAKIAAGADFSELRDVFENLYDRTERHFMHEEEFFAPTRFEHAARHKNEHDRLLLIFKRMCQGLDPATLAKSRQEYTEFLCGWLMRHIAVEDRPLGIHLNSLGIR